MRTTEPEISLPFMAVLAFWASSMVAKLTKPQFLWTRTRADSTAPKLEKMDWRMADEVDAEIFPIPAG